MARLNKGISAASPNDASQPVTASNAAATIPAKRKRGRPSKASLSLDADKPAAALQLEASDAATNPSALTTEPLVHRKRGRPPKARYTTSSLASIATEPKTPLDTAKPSLRRLTDPQALTTAIAAETQPGLTSPTSQGKKPSSLTLQQQPSIGADGVGETLEGIKRAVGGQKIPDEEFRQHLERLNPKILGDVLSIKHQLQAMSQNQAGPADSDPVPNKTATESRSAVAKEATAPDAQQAVPVTKEAATRSEQATTAGTSTGSGRADETAAPAMERAQGEGEQNPNTEMESRAGGSAR